MLTFRPPECTRSRQTHIWSQQTARKVDATIENARYIEAYAAVYVSLKDKPNKGASATAVYQWVAYEASKPRSKWL